MKSFVLLSLQSFGLAAVLTFWRLGFWVPSLAICGLAAVLDSQLLDSWVPNYPGCFTCFFFECNGFQGQLAATGGKPWVNSAQEQPCKPADATSRLLLNAMGSKTNWPPRGGNRAQEQP